MTFYALILHIFEANVNILMLIFSKIFLPPSSSPCYTNCINYLFKKLMVNSLLDSLKKIYPDFNFKPGKKFSFRPPRTIYYLGSDPNFNSLILHELGHALLEHSDFTTDIERLKMERAAWEKARELAITYGISLDNELIETELDTYRDWLHQKSRCKKCGLTRYQTPDGAYHCPHCER